MMTDSGDEHAPKLARDVAYAQVGGLLYGLREVVDSLIAIRVREFGDLLEGEEDELIQIKGSLDFLLSDIRESRIQKARVIRIVSNG